MHPFYFFYRTVLYSSRMNRIESYYVIPPALALSHTHNKHKHTHTVVCNARAKGLSELLKNIILFATDEETLELGQFLGITTYYSKEIFELMPKNAARAYADKTFKAIMAAKVYCVHLVSQLGYNILYQDVDVIWYKNPLPWFHNTSNPFYNFDMYYQDDGNHALYYAPYSANTGFYFIRNNPETQYFFNALLMNSDLIIASSSHQIALISLLNCLLYTSPSPRDSR